MEEVKKIYFDNILGEISSSLIVDNKIDCVEYDEYQITEHYGVNAKQTFAAYNYVDGNPGALHEDVDCTNGRVQIWNNIEIMMDNPSNESNIKFVVKCKYFTTKGEETKEMENVNIEEYPDECMEGNKLSNLYYIISYTPNSIVVNIQLISKINGATPADDVYIKENTIEVEANYFKSTTITKRYPENSPGKHVWKMPTNALMNSSSYALDPHSDAGGKTFNKITFYNKQYVAGIDLEYAAEADIIIKSSRKNNMDKIVAFRINKGAKNNNYGLNEIDNDSVLRSVEPLSTENYYYFDVRRIGKENLCLHHAKNIYDKYHKGRRTMSVTVVGREYLDVNSKVFITKMKQSDYEAEYENLASKPNANPISDRATVDEMAKKNAISIDTNGRIRQFLVTKNEQVYDGAYVQKLELMEVYHGK